MLTSCCAGRVWVGESIYERVDVYERRVILSEGAYILWEGGGILWRVGVYACLRHVVQEGCG